MLELSTKGQFGKKACKILEAKPQLYFFSECNIVVGMLAIDHS